VNAVSSVYETDPVGPPQADFLNAVCEVETSLEPHELYQTLKAIEQELGRKPGPRWGPRPIDLDLLLYGDEVIDEPELKVPHKELTNRAFVMIPLAEIAPDAPIPSGQNVSETMSHDAGAVRLYQRNWLKKS
jgi:2-amino-4-hydroxy-6-hydroxymethyldihydropteridine diphosphokinase